MKTFIRSVAVATASWALVVCASSTSPSGNSIHLSASQAAVLVTRIGDAAALHSDIAWLADSVNLVITAGAEANLVDVTTDLAAGPFYGVGLQRAITAVPNSFATFHLILFNDPSNPTDFIIIGGYRQSTTGAPPPETVNASFAAQAPNLYVTGHLFHIEGNTISEWRAETGTATLTTGNTSGDCANFSPTAGVTCSQTSLQSSFAIDVARHSAGSPNDTRNASMSSTEVAGIRLNFQ